MGRQRHVFSDYTAVRWLSIRAQHMVFKYIRGNYAEYLEDLSNEIPGEIMRLFLAKIGRFDLLPNGYHLSQNIVDDMNTANGALNEIILGHAEMLMDGDEVDSGTIRKT
jgi:hypothetical protein